jgi:hypothetical protein
LDEQIHNLHGSYKLVTHQENLITPGIKARSSSNAFQSPSIPSFHLCSIDGIAVATHYGK